MFLLELVWLLASLAGAVCGGGWPFLLFGINLGVLFLFAIDKRAAIKRLPRIPERELLFWTALGGSAGAMAAIILFRHKSAKWSVKGWVLFLFVVHCSLLAHFA